MISEGTRHFIKVAAATLFAFWVYSLYDNWQSERRAKKAEVDNFFRRSRLSPEQRIAEDKQKQAEADQQASIAQANARVAERQNIERHARSACLIRILPTLRDPSSADINVAFSYPEESGMHQVVLKGRAKNAFGGYAFGEWHCKGTWNGQSFNPMSIAALGD